MKNTKRHNHALNMINIENFKTPKQAFHNIRNYLAGQFIGVTRDDILLDEVIKCLYCKLILEVNGEDSFNVDSHSFELAKNVRAVFTTVRAKFPEMFEHDTEILLAPEALSFVMKQLDFSIMDAISDPIGDAFEVFIGSDSRGSSGQFFTPKSVTSLLVKALNPSPEETILDPACGAGGFLASVCSHLVDHGLKKNEITQLVNKNLYGIDKDAYLAKLAKAHISLLTGMSPNIICGDSLALHDGQQSIRKKLPKDGVDIILTNPPFGSRIVAASDDVLKTFDLAKKWSINKKTGKLAASDNLNTNVSPQILFVERCISLLKDGGRLGMVLPESMLSNKSYRHVVEYIMQHSNVQGIIGMPDALFKTSGKGGTHTKTCLLIATKNSNNSKSKSIFMAEAKWCGQDSRARQIPHNDLPKISINFEKYKNSKLTTYSTLGFIIDKSNINNFVLCPRYYDPQGDKEINALKESHSLIPFGQLVKEGVFTLSTGDEVGKLAYGTGDIPFIRTSDISNWELKADPKHSVSRDLCGSLQTKQNVQSGDILMVKDGTYLIGTCAIISECDTDIIYQSHLYKIRVNRNSYGIDPYLLLATLSSPVVQRQIRAKQFTQDIIDSLGERINELVLPIPKDIEIRKRVSGLVKKSVAKRIEAKMLAQEARLSLEKEQLSILSTIHS